MRYYLKRGDFYFCLFWMKRTKTAIHGWTSKSLIDKGNLDADTVDTHFSYPIDGNYHVSYKYRKSKQLVQVETVYHTQVKQKILSGGQCQEINLIPRHEYDPIKESFVLEDYDSPPWEAYENGSYRYNPLQTFVFVENKDSLIMRDEKANVKLFDKDLVLDLENCGEASYNVILSLVGNNSDRIKPLKDSKYDIYQHSIDNSNYPYMEITVLRYPPGTYVYNPTIKNRMALVP